MTIGEVISILNDVPEGFELEEWLEMPFMIEVKNELIEVEDYHISVSEIDFIDGEDAEGDYEDVAFIISPNALPPLDEDGFFSSPAISLN